MPDDTNSADRMQSILRAAFPSPIVTDDLGEVSWRWDQLVYLSMLDFLQSEAEAKNSAEGCREDIVRIEQELGIRAEGSQ